MFVPRPPPHSPETLPVDGRTPAACWRVWQPLVPNIIYKCVVSFPLINLWTCWASNCVSHSPHDWWVDWALRTNRFEKPCGVKKQEQKLLFTSICYCQPRMEINMYVQWKQLHKVSGVSSNSSQFRWNTASKQQRMGSTTINPKEQTITWGITSNLIWPFFHAQFLPKKTQVLQTVILNFRRSILANPHDKKRRCRKRRQSLHSLLIGCRHAVIPTNAQALQQNAIHGDDHRNQKVTTWSLNEYVGLLNPAWKKQFLISSCLASHYNEKCLGWLGWVLNKRSLVIFSFYKWRPGKRYEVMLHSLGGSWGSETNRFWLKKIISFGSRMQHSHAFPAEMMAGGFLFPWILFPKGLPATTEGRQTWGHRLDSPTPTRPTDPFHRLPAGWECWD